MQSTPRVLLLSRKPASNATPWRAGCSSEHSKSPLQMGNACPTKFTPGKEFSSAMEHYSTSAGSSSASTATMMESSPTTIHTYRWRNASGQTMTKTSKAAGTCTFINGVAELNLESKRPSGSYWLDWSKGSRVLRISFSPALDLSLPCSCRPYTMDHRGAACITTRSA